MSDYKSAGLKQIQRDLSLFEIHAKMKRQIKSPIPFGQQTARPPINKGVQMSEERLNTGQGVFKALSNYKKTATPDFSRLSSKFTIDTFFGIPKD